MRLRRQSQQCQGMYRHLELMPVTLSPFASLRVNSAKGLARWVKRSFAALRMTARTPLTSAHGKSSLQTPELDILPLTNPKILDILCYVDTPRNRIWVDRNVSIRGDTASLVLVRSSLRAFSHKELDIVDKGGYKLWHRSHISNVRPVMMIS